MYDFCKYISHAFLRNGPIALTQVGVNTLRAVVATGILLGSTSQVLAQSEGDSRKPIPVENFTNEQWLGQYVTNVAPPEIYELFSKNNGLSLLARTYSFKGNTADYCAAEVGITFAPTNPKQNPRIPSDMGWGASSGQSGMQMEGEDGCLGKALKRATSNLFAADAGNLKSGFNLIVDAGGKRTTKPKDDSTVNSVATGISDIGRQSIRDSLPDWFPKAFDYRNTQTRYAFNILNADAGRKVCIAVFGMTSRSPDDRNPRYPAANIIQAKLLERANAEEAKKDAVCFNPLFNAVIAQIEPSSSLVATYVDKWNLVSEPGLREPSKKAIADTYALWNTEQANLAKNEERASRQRPPPSRSTTRQTNRTSCTNDCMNGSCVRKFPDGTTERWQAPRKFDPFSQNWGWDTTTNACGL